MVVIDGEKRWGKAVCMCEEPVYRVEKEKEGIQGKEA